MTDLVVHNGPGLQLLVPFTYRSTEVVKAKTLGTTDYVKLRDLVDGSERIERGPQMLFLGAYEQITAEAQGLSLSSTDYVTVTDKATGEVHIKKGPCVWFPGPQEV